MSEAYEQLQKENAALKAEVERLTGNLKSLEERFNIGFQNFTREREISAMLREALEDCMDTIKRQWGNAHPEFVTAYDALAREKEMRK